jgi:hypothetical protein
MPKPNDNTDPKPNENNPADNGQNPDEQNPSDNKPDDNNPTPPDKHNEPTINRGRYEREMKEKQGEIDKLNAELEKLKKGAKSVDDAMAEVNKLREELADKDLTHQLDKAGCLNAKAAKALLPDYEGDVAKLIEGAPYLFGSQEQKPKGRTGGNPGGAPHDNEDAWMDKAFGIRK